MTRVQHKTKPYSVGMERRKNVLDKCLRRPFSHVARPKAQQFLAIHCIYELLWLMHANSGGQRWIKKTEDLVSVETMGRDSIKEFDWVVSAPPPPKFSYISFSTPFP